MSEQRYFGDLPGTDYDRDFWDAVYALYDEAFPGLPAAISRAASVGYPWAGVTTPFALFEGPRCVAHVGVLSHPMLVAGEPVNIAGIHAVCTTADRRRRGLCRELMGRALAFADQSHTLTKLHTDLPAVYEPHGFATHRTHRFVSTTTAAQPAKARLVKPASEPADAELFVAMLANRAPVSARLSSNDDGWMIGIVAALSGLIDEGFWWLPEHRVLVCFEEQDDAVLVHEVIASTLPPAELIAAASPAPDKPLVYTFAPDLLDPTARPTAAPPEIGMMMLRGNWPELEFFGVSPLWEH